MKKLLILSLLSGILAFGQANPVKRIKSYAGAPTAGDCNAATIGVLWAINTTASPDTLHYCVEVGASPTWVQIGTGGGTVTSVDVSVPSNLLAISGNPITTAGTLAFTLPTRAANLVFAGPASAGPSEPSFRALVAADIPDLSGTYQPLDTDLTTIAGFSPSRGAIIRRGASAWESLALGATGAVLQSDGTDAVWTPRVSTGSAIDFASAPDGACLESTFALTGAVVGDPVALGIGTALPSGVSATARISALDTAQIQICNLSGAAVDLTSRTFTVRVVR